MIMKYKKFRQIKDERVNIVLERIEILKGMMKRKPDFKERYETLIKRIAKKYRINI
jgi:RNase P subunit RPR2